MFTLLDSLDDGSPALKWRNIGADSITIEARYSRGDWDAPKSASSKGTISVDRHVLQRMEDLKSREVIIRAGRAKRRYRVVKSAGPEDLVFQSVTKGAPITDNWVLSRKIKPIARRLGIDWVNWQVLRRSCATWLQQAGVDVKDAQGILRHSRASTTQDIYQQVVSESQRRAVTRLSAFVQRQQQCSDDLECVFWVGKRSAAGCRSATNCIHLGFLRLVSC